jgi:hypothetical protein
VERTELPTACSSLPYLQVRKKSVGNNMPCELSFIQESTLRSHLRPQFTSWVNRGTFALKSLTDVTGARKNARSRSLSNTLSVKWPAVLTVGLQTSLEADPADASEQLPQSRRWSRHVYKKLANESIGRSYNGSS